MIKLLGRQFIQIHSNFDQTSIQKISDFIIMFGAYTKEVNTLVQIMKTAIPLTLAIQKDLEMDEIKKKQDGSFVSIADYATQAIIMDGINRMLPGDDVYGEENMNKCNEQFLTMVKRLLPNNLDPVKACEKAIQKFGPENHRVWVIDPIDGTAGFVVNDSYAIASALLVDLHVVCSITAWPLHDPKFTGIPINGPVIFIAVENAGAWAMDMQGNTIDMTRPTEIKKGLLTNGLGRVQNVLKTTFDVDKIVSMPSMTKGFILASGECNIYARIHKALEYVWDVAPFELFVRLCGGIVTDGTGKPLEYTTDGKVKDSDKGILCTMGGEEFHYQVLSAMQDGMKRILNINCRV